MRILVSVANSISSRAIFDKVLEDSGLDLTEVVVMRLTSCEQRIMRWAYDHHWRVSVDPKNLEEVCEAVDAAIVIRRGRARNVGDDAIEKLRSLGKPVHVHEMNDAKFKTNFGSITRA